MKHIIIVLALSALLGLSIVSVGAAVPEFELTIKSASGKCNQISVTYHPYGAFGETFLISWSLFQGKTVVASDSGDPFISPQNTDDFDTVKTLTLPSNLAAGTYIIEFDGEGDGKIDSQTFTVPACDGSSTSDPVELPPCEIEDTRLDEGCGSTFVVTYAQAREDGCYINVYSPYGRTDGKTAFLLQVTPAEIAAAQAVGGNAVIDSIDVVNLTNVTVYWLAATGEFQINAGPNAEGKVYVLNFTGCPATNIYTSNSHQG